MAGLNGIRGFRAIDSFRCTSLGGPSCQGTRQGYISILAAGGRIEVLLTLAVRYCVPGMVKNLFISLLTLTLAVSIRAQSASETRPAGAPGQPQPEQEWLSQAKQAEAAGDFSRAAECYVNYLKVRPEEAEIHQRLGLVYYLSNRFDEALPVLQRALKLDPRMWGSALYLGVCYYRTGQFNKALTPLREAIHIKPSLPDGHFWLGSTLLALGQTEDAIAQLQKVASDAPVGLEASALLVRAYRETAEKYYRRIEKASPDSYRIHQLEGENLIWTQREHKAVSEFQNALSQNPQLEDAHRMLGDLYWQQHDPEAARKEYEAELRVTPLSDIAHLRLGQYWLAKADVNRAAEYLERSLKLNKNLSESNRDLGKVWLARGDPAKAEPFLEAAVQQNADDPLTHGYLADLYRRTSREDLAKKEQSSFEKLSGAGEKKQRTAP